MRAAGSLGRGLAGERVRAEALSRGRTEQDLEAPRLLFCRRHITVYPEAFGEAWSGCQTLRSIGLWTTNQSLSAGNPW